MTRLKEANTCWEHSKTELRQSLKIQKDMSIEQPNVIPDRVLPHSHPLEVCGFLASIGARGAQVTSTQFPWRSSVSMEARDARSTFTVKTSIYQVQLSNSKRALSQTFHHAVLHRLVLLAYFQHLHWSSGWLPHLTCF